MNQTTLAILLAPPRLTPRAYNEIKSQTYDLCADETHNSPLPQMFKEINGL